MSVKRYVVFGYDQYYPRGGWTDYVAGFDTEEEAREFVSQKASEAGYRRDYYDVVDLQDPENFR